MNDHACMAAPSLTDHKSETQIRRGLEQFVWPPERQRLL